ncbi:MAG TPA: CheR family methyltransferase, partial [Oceanipulchritudo sp.]|nr:CheR family methyltransferase [Oceanipulchritudo sp.]
MRNHIVTLGASAGGLAALEAFFKAVPPHPGYPFVIVQHLSPDFKSLMSQLLAAYTEIPIREVRSRMEIEPDHIYLIPAGSLMRVKEGRFNLEPRNPEKMPINIFMKSIAAEFGADSIGIVFSGTGSDGTEGCRAIREAGGLVLAQSPESAEFESMPKSIISNRLSHAEAAPAEMWEILAAYTGDTAEVSLRATSQKSVPGDEIIGELNIGYSQLFSFLKRLYELDFSEYKITSVSRRIQRRMEQCSIHEITDYLQHLESDEQETDALYRDLLIGVTAFFRDPDVYEALAREVIRPMLTEAAKKQEEFRIWVAGCASGEEAYSVAILTDEIARECSFTGTISIFATDMHKGSVETAGQGIYTKKELTEMDEARISRYFKRGDDGRYRVRPEIRKRVIFAQHNLLNDPPFTRIDLITCRNLLIYLKPQAQELVLRSFHYALRRGGHLLLGSSESLGNLEEHFKSCAAREKIFRKKEGRIGPLRPKQMFKSQERHSITQSQYIPPEPAHTISIEKNLLKVYDELLGRHAPSGVLITPGRQIKHYFGDSSAYCIPRAGRADNDFLSLLQGDLKLAVSTSIQRVLSGRKPVQSKGIRCNTREGELVLDLTVEPYLNDQEDPTYLLVSFNPRHPVPPESEPPASETPGEFHPAEETQGRILMLEDELRSTKENLQATVEELQTSNEELQAINEEVQVSNEELQSTNEELHSMNEELYTVNAELQQKNQQLFDLNAEHENLLLNTEDGILYVDRELRIKKYNPAISFAFNLMPQDIGRPAEHIAYTLQNRDEMLNDLREVLRTGTRREREGRTSDGTVFLRRFTPFLDDDEAVAGVVLTFTNITESSRMRDQLSRAMRTASMAWWEWDLTSKRLAVHAEGECILGYDCDSLDGTSDYWFSRVHPDDLTAVRESLQKCIDGETTEWVCEHRFLNAGGIYEWVINSGKVVRWTRGGEAVELTGTTMNIHERKVMELDLRASKEAAEAAMVAKSNFLSIMSHEIRTPLNGITGMAELLKLELKDPKVEKYVSTINESATHLLELINGILDYSKAEAGRMELHLEHTDLLALVQSTAKIMAGKADEKRIRIEAKCLLNHSSYKLDAVRIRQVLMNLLANAIKFTPDKGRIWLEVKELSDLNLQFKIADNGIGISPEVKLALFEPFTQADSSFSRSYGGTGLGLSICRQMVELMGGSIDVQSEPGKGSTFFFIIPRRSGQKRPAKARPPIPPVSATSARRTLVVDDDRTNAKVLSLMLQKCGLEADYVDSGETCLAALRKKDY